MTRQRLADAAFVLGLLGLGVLFYGWAFYPPLAWPLAVANLVYLLALAVAWIIARLTGHRRAVGDCSVQR